MASLDKIYFHDPQENKLCSVGLIDFVSKLGLTRELLNENVKEKINLIQIVKRSKRSHSASHNKEVLIYIYIRYMYSWPFSIIKYSPMPSFHNRNKYLRYCLPQIAKKNRAYKST